MSKHVYPVPGLFLQDQPAIEHDCDDPRCLETGAFTTKRPPPIAAATVTTEDPAEAGSPDSADGA